jgi:tetratricopeptide (TPR) repeat protein
MLEIPLSWTSIDANMRMILYLNLAGDYKQFRTHHHRRIAMRYLEMAGRLADSSIQAYDQKDEVLRRMARIHYDQGEYEQALELSMQSLRLSEERLAAFTFNQHKGPLVSLNNKFNHMVNKYWVYDCLYMTYTRLGDYRQALEYYILTRKSEEEIYQKQNQDLITLMEAEAKDERTKNRIDLLARDNELKALAIRQSRTLNLGIAGLFVVVVLIGLLFLRQNKMKNEHKTVLLEQKLLRLQMNPHFIFNALSNILNFIDMKENEKASVYLTTFGRLLRTTLESTREDMVPFEKEVSSLGNYLELQKLRYREKFEYAIEVDEKIDREDMSIPPMLVQPFIENAIEHGIRHKKTPGRIEVRFLLRGRKIVCEVEDDGVGREKAWEAEVNERAGHRSLATDIIRDRINTLNKKFKQKIQLEIIDKLSENSGAMGTKVVLDLPYRTVYG